MNREQRRRKTKNRLYTKKGYTRVIKIDDDDPTKALNIPTKVGSKIHHLAQSNVKKMKRSERSK